MVSVDEGALRMDVLFFEQLVESESPQDWGAAANLYCGPLLQGLNLDTNGFDNWLAGERERLRGLACGSLERLAGHQEKAGKMEEACGTEKRLLTLDPSREEGH